MWLEKEEDNKYDGIICSNVIDVFVDSTSTAYAITGSYEVYIVE